jgi:hypothetical protein
VTWVFVFACAAFFCHGAAKPGNGEYYAAKAACIRAALVYAKRHRIGTGHWEVACVERER